MKKPCCLEVQRTPQSSTRMPHKENRRFCPFVMESLTLDISTYLSTILFTISDITKSKHCFMNFIPIRLFDRVSQKTNFLRMRKTVNTCICRPSFFWKVIGVFLHAYRHESENKFLLICDNRYP